MYRPPENSRLGAGADMKNDVTIMESVFGSYRSVK